MTTEGKIIQAWQKKDIGITNIGYKDGSYRDSIHRYRDGIKKYFLWDTCIFWQDHVGNLFIKLSSEQDAGNYYQYGRMKDVVITNTTKNRLNMFLILYGFSTLKQKNKKIYYNDSILEVDKIYRLNTENKILELVQE